jgi:hypothetical protein
MNPNQSGNTGPLGVDTHKPTVDAGTMIRHQSKPAVPTGVLQGSHPGQKGKDAPRKTSGLYDPKDLDAVAFAALNAILVTSINSIKEWGGMLYVKNGKCVAMEAVSQAEPNKVDVGQDKENCSCPPGTTPVAYYHTHPVYQIAGFKGDYNKMSDEDKAVAKDHTLDAAYLGTVDGSFFKYIVEKDTTIKFKDRLKNTGE